MIELVDLKDWKKQKDILLDLYKMYGISINSREWRREVEKWNKMFASSDVDYYIAHSNTKGFKATRDYLEAKESRDDYMKRAFNMLKKARQCDKAFNQLNNFKFDFENGEIK